MRDIKRSTGECSCPTKQPQVKSFKIEGPIIGKCCSDCMYVLEWRKATPEEVEEYNNSIRDPNQMGMFDNPPVASVAADVPAPPPAAAPAAIQEAPSTSVLDESWPAPEDEPATIGTECYQITDIFVGTNPYFIRVFTPVGSFEIPTTQEKATAAVNNKSIFVGKTGTFEVARTSKTITINKILKLA